MRQAPSTNIQPISCQAVGNCQPRSPIRPWNHKQVLPRCVFLTSALPPTCAVRSQLPQRELTGCSHQPVQFHFKVSASQQTWLAVNKTRQGKMEDWLGATKKGRILLVLVSVDEAPPVKPRGAAASSSFGENLATKQVVGTTRSLVHQTHSCSANPLGPICP